MTSTQSGEDQTVSLIFSVVDTDRSESIEGHELLHVLSAMNYAPSPALLQHLSEHCHKMGRSDMKALLQQSAKGTGSAKRNNLGMLCSSFPQLGAVFIVREGIDTVLSSSTLLRRILRAWGFTPESSLSPSERARLYAAMWNAISGGAWALSGWEIDHRLKSLLSSYLVRVLWASGRGAIRDTSGVPDAVASVKAHLSDDNALFSCRAVSEATTAGADAAPAAWSEVEIPFPVFADAWESLVQYADGHTARAPGSLLLWRIYCVMRACEGFPVGSPHAVCAESGWGLLALSHAVKGAGTDARAETDGTRPRLCVDERYVVELGPAELAGGVEGGTERPELPPSLVCKLAAHRQEMDLAEAELMTAGAVSGAGSSAELDVEGDTDKSAEVILRGLERKAALAVTAPTWVDLRWSSFASCPQMRHAGAGGKLRPTTRAWWSPGSMRVLDLHVDEEDVARMAAMGEAFAALLPAFRDPSSMSATFNLEQAGLAAAMALLAGDDGPIGSAAVAAARATSSPSVPRRLARPANSISIVANKVQPRLLDWFGKFADRVAIDPTGEAAVARWLFVALSTPDPRVPAFAPALRRATDPGQGCFCVAEVRSTVVTKENKASSPTGYRSIPSCRSVVELGGPSLVSHLMAMWYHANLEVASAATAAMLGAAARGSDAAGSSSAAAAATPGGSSVRDSDAVDSRLQVPMLPADGSGNAAARAAAAFARRVPFDAPRPSARRIPAESLCVVFEGTASPADEAGALPTEHAPLTWASAIETAWPVMRDDVLFAAYSACFPAPLPAKMGFAAKEGAVNRAKAVINTPSSRDNSTPSVNVWESSAIPMRGAVEAMVLDPDGWQATGAWDGKDPFDPAARWITTRPRLDGSELPSHAPTGSHLIHLTRERSAGRVSAMHWLAEASAEPARARLLGARSRQEHILAPYDRSVAGAVDDWSVSLAVAVWAKVRKSALWRAKNSPPGANLAFALWAGKKPCTVPDAVVSHLGESAPNPTEGLSRCRGFEADVLAAALRTRESGAWSPTLAGLHMESAAGGVGAGAAARKAAAMEVRQWARDLVGADESHEDAGTFALGWDTLLALAVWRDAEKKLPLNACAMVDLEPEAGAARTAPNPLNGDCPSEAAWCVPGRTMALLMALSQSLNPALRSWAARAKSAMFAILKERPTTYMPRHLSSARSSEQTAMTIDIQSRVWRYLFENRATLVPQRLTVDRWAAIPAQGVDTLPGSTVDAFAGSASLFARCLYLVGSSSEELLDQLRKSRV
ncbi:hypothetical protein FNF29_06250 [Cafeteria roenbergensis]|uniref:EF-hand domain-containing protein n=2 Tax=Cafeteria roenbergensis TaxID=33653 RepID=A0A5A8C7A1_CAFRO|nr:hypothetical protein FNF29_06250 [Cafeteria roenbergensis]|eukprot:KAA0148966.1 hypothetical protein FNF29_06250 [Cafeteria roenbergensis]